MPYIPAKTNASDTDTDARCTTLRFMQITLNDIPTLAGALAGAPWRTCDYSVGGLMMWVDYFNYEFAVADGTLFIKGLDEADRRHPAFAVPVGGNMPLAQAVALLREYCGQNGEELLFSAVPGDLLDALSLLGAKTITPLTDWSDYLYRASDLATLQGHRYNKKRNHVNRFLADNPGAFLEPLNQANAHEAIALLERLDSSGKADEALATFEREQTLAVLRNLDRYTTFEGAILRDSNGAAVAFTLGEKIGDTLILHIEKMDHNVAGAGEAINKLFAADFCARHPEVQYINREEDAGDPGLRRAKESYCPTRILAKYNVRF